MPRLPCIAVEYYARRGIVNSTQIRKMVAHGDITALCGKKALRVLRQRITMNGANPFAVCKAAQKRHGFGKKKLERCIRSLKRRR